MVTKRPNYLTEFSRSSIGPTLMTFDEFVRLAPGVYALREDWAKGRISREQIDRVLLSEPQCKLYCQARWAGEPRTLYPAWAYAAELSWARWAARKGNGRLLESLLAGADITKWPVGPAELQSWLKRLKRGVHYSLNEPLRVPLDETIPTIQDVLAAGLWARQQGHISWMSANRVTGRRVDDRHSASILAALTVLKIVRPAEHWQGKHLLSEDSEFQIDQMMDHAFEERDGWPRQLQAFANDSALHQLCRGWLQNQDVGSLLKKLIPAETNGSVVDRREEEENSDILTELKRRAKHARIAELVSR